LINHYVKEVLRVPGYVRYVDDFALFGNDAEQMQMWRGELDRFLTGQRLSLHPRKRRVIQREEPAEFLGFELPARSAGPELAWLRPRQARR